MTMAQDFPPLPPVRSSLSQADAATDLSALLAAVAGANRMLQDSEREKPGEIYSGMFGARTDDLIEKLKTWLNRLNGALKAIASALKASSYSVSVGTTVSVTITFGSTNS